MRYKISDDELHRLGIARGAQSAFPNKCHGDVSISNEFFDRFRTRGFSLEAACFAITSPWIHYNADTGRPLTATDEFLLEVPDCFKYGTPFLDCRHTFDLLSGRRMTGAEQQAIHTRAAAVDVAVRRVLAAGRYANECRCQDIRWDRSRIEIGFSSAVYCRIDSAPACLEQMSQGKIRTGALVPEVDGYRFEGVPTKGGTDYGVFDISSRLPRGYAYRTHSPEGDDDTPYVVLPPGRRIGIGVQ